MQFSTQTLKYSPPEPKLVMKMSSSSRINSFTSTYEFWKLEQTILLCKLPVCHMLAPFMHVPGVHLVDTSLSLVLCL